MTLRQGLATVLLAWVAFPAALAWAQGAPAYEVRRGDTLFAVVRKAMHPGVSRNQMLLGIWRANQKAFPGGNPNLLEVGTVLNIPPKDAIAAIPSAEADREVRALLARPAAPAPVAVVKPAVPAIAKPAAPVLGGEEAARRYREGLALERNGDDQGALKAFLEAGEAGNGQAQLKLGRIYDKGNAVVQRDYQLSLKWYQKAREQGIDIERPLPRMTTK